MKRESKADCVDVMTLCCLSGELLHHHRDVFQMHQRAKVAEPEEETLHVYGRINAAGCDGVVTFTMEALHGQTRSVVPLKETETLHKFVCCHTVYC